MKSFGHLLQKRVKNNNDVVFDFYTIEKATKEALNNLFGLSGEKNVFLKKWNDSQLVFYCPKSLWKSEISLNSNKLIEQINQRLKKELIKKIIVN